MAKVIYDSLNRLVWVQGQKSIKKTGAGFYGKDAKRFSNNNAARSYAIRLAKSRKEKGIYDRYYGKNIPIKRNKKYGKKR